MLGLAQGEGEEKGSKGEVKEAETGLGRRLRGTALALHMLGPGIGPWHLETEKQKAQPK